MVRVSDMVAQSNITHMTVQQMAKGKKATTSAAKGTPPADGADTPATAADATTTASAATGGTTMKKVDAVRAALADGVESPTEGVSYIKKTFGIVMTPQAFSTSKFQIRTAKG